MSDSMSGACSCANSRHESRRVVLTGGPGAGKTAILEIVKRHLCRHVAVLPEAASIIFKGGFERKDCPPAKRAAQRAIFHVQRELERLDEEEARSALSLCDRGSLDGLAYWPSPEEDFFSQLGINRADELSRYRAVIHLRTPSLERGYNHLNPMRIESDKEAAEIDTRIEKAWEGHPRRFVVESTDDFMTKARRALELIRAELPSCCHSPP